MRFDFCIGNPPYQGEGDNLQQVYPLFYLGGRDIADCVEMIFPSAWQEPKNGSGLSRLNKKEIKEDKQIVLIDNQDNVFHNVNGAKNTNIIIWKRGYDNSLNGKQLVYENGKNPVPKKLVCNQDEIEKPDEINLLAEIVKRCDGFVGLDSITSVLKPYGLRTDVIENFSKYGLPEIYAVRKHVDDIVLYHRNNGVIKKYYVNKNYPFPKATNNIDKFKVFVGKTWGNMSLNTGLGGAYSDIIIACPNDVCTEKFLESGSFSDYVTVKKHAKYLMTKFCRALLFRNKSIQDNSKDKWCAVPVQDYHEEFWNGTIAQIDEALMDKYDVPKNVRTFIANNIQGRSESNIVNLH